MICTVCRWVEKEGNLLTPDGLIRINPKKKMYGSLMLVADVPVFSGSFMNMKKKVGFIAGEVKALQKAIKFFRLQEGTDFSEAVAPHRIVTIELLESDTPENMGFRAKINPSTQELLLRDGEQIMWKTDVVPEGSHIRDTYITYNSTTPLSDPELGNGVTASRGFTSNDYHFVGAADVDISIKAK